MQDLDDERVEEFSTRMLEILNGGLLSLLTSIGHQTGLFEIMSTMPSSTIEQIADASGLNERHVQEWLAAMVVGRIVEYDPVSNSYLLPPEHAALLTGAKNPNNMARSAQVIPMLAEVEEGLVESFNHGCGVPYSAYTRFMEFVAERNTQRFDSVLITKIIPLIPESVEGLKHGIDVLDVGCGNGHVLNLMAREFPESRFTGYDFLEEYIEAAKTEARSLGLSNVHFEALDVETLREFEKYELITAFDVIHDLAQPSKVLEAIVRALRSDGVFFMADVAGSSHLHENLDYNMAPWMYSVSCLHCVPISLALGGVGLGAMWGNQKAQQMLLDAGFTGVQVLQIPGDPVNSYYVASRNTVP